MSVSTTKLPGLQKEANYWVDVEVPYTKIKQKWDRKYRGKLHNHMKNNRLQKRILEIYFKPLSVSLPNDRTEAISMLEKENKDWIYNLSCQFYFSNGVSEKDIREFTKSIKSEICGAGLEEQYDKIMGEKEDTAANKDGMITLCQLVEPDYLRRILIYHRANSRYPKNIFKRDNSGVPERSEWKSLIEHLDRTHSDQYQVWHQFRFDGDYYIAIEQEDRDGVERQVGQNIEEEPANLIILTFRDQYLDVYADTRTTTITVQNGVNNDIENGEYEEEVNKVESDEIQNFADSLQNKDVERDQNDTKDDYDYIMTDVWVDHTPLANNPQLKISSSDGVGRAIEQLENYGIEILSDGEKISKIKISFDDNVFTIYNVERTKEGKGTYRELVYGTEANPSVRGNFEDLIRQEFGLDISYQSSSQ